MVAEQSKLSPRAIYSCFLRAAIYTSEAVIPTHNTVPDACCREQSWAVDLQMARQ